MFMYLRLLLSLSPTHSPNHLHVDFFTIYFNFQVKTGPFAEHSNTLWGISGVAEWSKVNSGLIKMYKAEVMDSLRHCTCIYIDDIHHTHTHTHVVMCTCTYVVTLV